jgi:geranylgeranyl pyrophosphate synthase
VSRTQFPEHFQGIFARVRDKHGRLFIEARESLRSVPMSEEFRPYFLSGVLGHAQPGFMLVPLMHLALADTLGGVGDQDRAYLPWNILAMEYSAILDDTVDRTPYRSGGKTYVHRFGEASSTAMTNYVFSLLLARAAEISRDLIPVVTDYVSTFSSHLVWELHSRYPPATIPACERWMKLRYEAVTSAVDFTFNGVLALRGMPSMRPEVCARLGEVTQDIDDLVNFLDQRERAGENDDIKMGIMSNALLHTLRSNDTAASALEALWEPYRRIPATSLDRFWEAHAKCSAETATQYEALATLVTEHGVLATAHKIVDDARACVLSAPEPFRPCICEIVDAFVARLHRLDALPQSSRAVLSEILAAEPLAYARGSATEH